MELVAVLIILEFVVIIVLIARLCSRKGEFKELQAKNQELSRQTNELEAELFDSQYFLPVFMMARSHELKNYLCAIKNTVSQNVADGGIRGILKQVHAISVSAIDYLNSELKNTYHGQENIPIKAFSVIDIIKDIIRDFGYHDLKSDVPLDQEKMDRLKKFQSNEYVLRLILSNIINNAKKYGGDKTPQISLNILNTNGDDYLVCEISNKKSCDEQSEKLTKSFSAEEPIDNSYGIYLSKLLTKRLRGRLDLDLEGLDGGEVIIKLTLPYLKH